MTTRSPRRGAGPFPTGLAALALLGGALAGCPGRPPPPPGVDPLLLVRSGPTTVEIERATGALRVLSPTGDEVGRFGGGTCGPFALALRPDDDDGSRYPDPEDDPGGWTWLAPLGAAVLSEEPLVVRYTLGAEGVERTIDADVSIFPDEQGFVSLEAGFDVREREVALVRACFGLAGARHVVGGGEVFDGVDLYGRVIPLSFRIGGNYASGINEAHAPVPFFATPAGLGVLVETERPGAFDVGVSAPDRLEARFFASSLGLRVRAGDVVANVAAHNRFMGLPPVPPRWALAPQQWRNEHAVTVEDGVVLSDGRDRFLDDAATLRALDIPTTALWIDAPWSTGYNTFAFNWLQFPDAPTMIDYAERELGYRVIVWATEHLNVSNDEDQQVGMPAFGSLGLYRAFREAGWLVGTPSGDPLILPWGRGQGSFVDFTNPQAVAAWQELMRPLLEMGVRGFKLDYGESMRAELLGLQNDLPIFHDGSSTAVQHTRYARLYHEAYLGALERVHPGDHFIITRTGGIYDQQNGVAIWPGDLDNDFSRAGDPLDDDTRGAVGGLPAAISGGLSLSMSGYPLYGSDIGGYRGGTPTTEVLLRWAQFGALSTIMQLGGGGSGDGTHNPWDERYDTAVAVPVYRRYARLHMDLVPYLEHLLAQASTVGTPPLVPLGVAAPDDEAAWADPDAFLLGPDLYVAPVVEAGATRREVRFPEGTWFSWWTDEITEGPTTQEVDAPLDTLPLFLRAGGIIPLGDHRLDTVVPAADTSVADPEPFGFLRILTSSGEDNELELPDGTVVTTRTVGQGLEVHATGPLRTWVLEVVLRDDGQGPWPLAPIRTGLFGTVAVPTLDDLYGCIPPCTLRTDTRLYALVDGSEAWVVFGDVPDGLEDRFGGF